MNKFKEPDNKYLNINILSQDDNPLNYSSAASYDVTKQFPILDDPSKYYVAVIDYKIPLSLIPVTIIRVIPNQDPLSVSYNPNKMTSTFTITYNGIDYTENVIYVPTTNYPPPIQDKPTQVIDYYYFIFTYNHLLNDFNTTISNLVTAAGLAVPAPFFVLSNTSPQKIKLIVADSFIASGAVLGMNKYAANYLSGFDYYFEDNNIVNPIQFVFYTNTNICNQYGVYDPNGQYWSFEQQYYALSEWSQLDKIIITTKSLPIINEEITSRNILSPDLSNFYPILYSSNQEIRTGSGERTSAYYDAIDQYRLVDLTSNIPLKRISIDVQWQTNTGQIFPFYLQAYQSINVKLGFFRKELYKSIN